jgi:SAM-dependent methyltransferase
MTGMGDAPGVTNKHYWDKWAACWEEVQDTFATDQYGVIKQRLQRYLQPNMNVVDFGCGGGRYLSFIAPRVCTVLGIDISDRLLDIAREIVQNRRLRNVELRCADLGAASAQKLALPASDFAVCTNVLISPEPITRGNILGQVASSLRSGCKLFLVVPAVSSALNIRDQHKRWVKERRRRRIKVDVEVERMEESTPEDERRGVFRRDGVRTKHFRLAELQQILGEHGFVVCETQRVEYSWNTEFEKPTRFLDRDTSVRRPFDWLLIAERTEGRDDCTNESSSDSSSDGSDSSSSGSAREEGGREEKGPARETGPLHARKGVSAAPAPSPITFARGPPSRPLVRGLTTPPPSTPLAPTHRLPPAPPAPAPVVAAATVALHRLSHRPFSASASAGLLTAGPAGPRHHVGRGRGGGAGGYLQWGLAKRAAWR